MAIRITPPTVEPMTAAEVRLRLKYPRTDQDEAITEWIRAARDAVERYTERGLLTQTWRLSAVRGVAGQPTLPVGAESTESHADWFVRNLIATRAAAPRAVIGDVLNTYGYVDLPWAAPLQTIDSITDDAGAVSTAAYVIDDTVEPVRVWWLDMARPTGLTTIVYRVGYGDAGTDIPPQLRQVVFALVQQYFLFRDGPPPLSALDDTLRAADGYRVRVLA